MRLLLDKKRHLFGIELMSVARQRPDFGMHIHRYRGQVEQPPPPPKKKRSFLLAPPSVYVGLRDVSGRKGLISLKYWIPFCEAEPDR